MIEIFVLSLNLVKYALSFQGDLALKELGAKQYDILTAKSHLPVHGTCWHNALNAVKVSCDKLNDHQHSLLALRLANCFLEDSGHATYDCYLVESDEARKKCINDMSDRAFGVYNEFYTHTTHICFYLNHELWQIQTENTIKKLYAASSKMTEQLVEASEVHDSMLQSQKEGLELQNQLLRHGQQLGDVIKLSTESVNNMVSDFKETSRDQQALLYEIFSYLRSFQDWIIGEVSWFQSIMYYIVACVVCALFSSTKKTSNARITLFTILSVNVIMERMLVQYNVNTVTSEEKIELIYCAWWLRKIALFLCTTALLYSYYSYRDEVLENYKTLKRIEKKLNCLQESQPIRYRTRLAVKRLNNAKSDQLNLQKNLDSSRFSEELQLPCD